MNYSLNLVFILTLIGAYRNPIVECVKAVGHGQKCADHVAECKLTLICDPDPTSGEKVCKCRDKFDWFPNIDKCIECEEVLGGSCSETVSQEKCCKEENNLICEDGKCACKLGMEALPNGKCARKNTPTAVTTTTTRKPGPPWYYSQWYFAPEFLHLL